MPTDGSPSAWTSPNTTALTNTATPGVTLRRSERSRVPRNSSSSVTGASSTMASASTRDLPARGPVGRLHDVLLGGVPVELLEEPIGISATSWRPMPAKNHGTSANQAPAGGGSRGRSRLRSAPVPLRRATNASQAMMAKFCAQIEHDERGRTVRVVGIDHERRRDHRDDEADGERGDDVADAPADRRRAPGPPTVTTRRRAAVAAAGAAEAAAGGRCSLPGTLPVACGIRDRSRRLTPASPHSRPLPAPSDVRRGP